MSAPDTNIESQEAKHRPSLWGIKGAMIFGALMMIGLVAFNMVNTGDGEAVSNTSGVNAETDTVATDVYEPGTNSSATPTATD
ncbi:hypothetical protein [uncultured Sulfitobacter sp.]|uniref:hypothetical protein n=1 Tax=uncultured Sulfitobacter sp. TaxID=191468 RepID=UPI002607A3F2|nr:hypothetical protein [uncultured Sulfitobacter sp.]